MSSAGYSRPLDFDRPHEHWECECCGLDIFVGHEVGGTEQIIAHRRPTCSKFLEFEKGLADGSVMRDIEAQRKLA